MRSSFLFLLIFGAACTTGGPRPLPDARIDYDAGTASQDAGVDVDGGTCAMGSTIGQPCATDTQCSDGCFCNGPEVCSEGMCAAGDSVVCDDGIDCTVDTCDDESQRCTVTANDARCQDGDACNGAEVCQIGLGCRDVSPLYCNDENSCTVDDCDPDVGCTHVARDLDGDGYSDSRCGGDDCNDDPRDGTDINPGAMEVCGNRRDDNCDGFRDYLDRSCSPTNGSCMEAQVLPGPGVYPGSTKGLENSTALGCGSGRDSYFRFTLTETRDVRVSVAGGNSTSVGIRALTNCAGAAETDLVCGFGTPASAFVRSVPAGEYVIIVQQSGSSDAFDLTLRFDDPTMPPPVDTCGPGTTDVSAGGTFEGLWGEVADDYELSCSASGRVDAVYQFTIDSPKDVTLQATSSGGGFGNVLIALASDCDDPRSELSCSNRSDGITRRELPAGTYWILLETTNRSHREWELRVDIRDPSPQEPGDLCSGAIDITSAMGSVDLSAMESDGGVSCGAGTSADAYFYFDLAETRDVTVNTNIPSFSSYFALSTACGAVGAERRCVRASNMASHNFRSLEAGRYYVTLATFGRSGTATASIETRPPTPVPPNDRCAGAIDISPPSYRSTDTLVDFEDDVSGTSCSECPDAIYTLTLTEPREILVSASRVDGAGTSALRMTLREDCEAGPNIATHNGHPSTLSEELEPGTYFLIVESSRFSLSDYNLRVSYF